LLDSDLIEPVHHKDTDTPQFSFNSCIWCCQTRGGLHVAHEQIHRPARTKRIWIFYSFSLL